MTDLPSMAPHSNEAEQAVLGAVLLDNAVLPIARQLIAPEDFYLSIHQTIFLAMQRLVDRCSVIDNLTLSEALHNQGVLKEIGGSAYLAELLSTVPSAANIKHHARLVAEKAKIRKLRHSLRTTLEVLEGGANLDQVTARMTQLQCAATELLSAPIHSTPEMAPSGGFAPIPVSQLLDEPEPNRPEFILDELLAPSWLVALIAKAKAGKSTLVYQMLVRIAQGQPFLGRTTRQSPVLILAPEEPRGDIIRRLRSLGAEGLENIHIHIGLLDNVDKTLRTARAFIADHGIKLVVIDTLNTFWSVEDENDSVAVTNAVKPLLRLARESGACVLLIHHARKSEGEYGDEIRGSTALLSLLDAALIMKHHQTETQRKLKVISRYPDTPTELILELREHGYECLGDPASVSKAGKLTKLAEQLGETPANVKDIAQRAGVAVKSAYPLLDQLVSEGRAIRTGEGKRKSPFLYSFPLYKQGGLEETNRTNGHGSTNGFALTGNSFLPTPHSKGLPRNETISQFVSSDPHTTQTQRNEVTAGQVCGICNGSRFWRSIHGAENCGDCCRPASPDLVAEWI